MIRKNFLGSRTVLTLSALLVVLACSITVFAQQGTSAVRGTVADPQGNVVSGASVTLTSLGTAATRTTTTSESGVYVFDFLAVGDYKVEVEAAGFKKAVVTDIHALVAKSTTVDVALEVGNVAETVTVSSGSAELLVNKEDATLGNNFVSKQITDLPLEARNVNNLLSLQPATTREGFSAGARADQSNVTLDGVDINEAETNQITNPNTDPADSTNALNLVPDRNTVLRLNAEAVEEFRVTTTNANANQGRSGGAQVALVTKSGTNEWHGALFEFYRTKKFTANNFFSNLQGRPKPDLIRHTFGGAVGGPIIKDRAFFFYSFEGDRITRSQLIENARNVPLPSLGQGLVKFTGCPPGTLPANCGNGPGQVTPTPQTLTIAQLNTIFPAVGINPVAVAALASAAARYPANDFTVGDGLNTAGFKFNTPLPAERNSHVAKFDFNLTGNQQAFIRTNVIYDKIARERQFPDTPAPTIWSHPIGIAAGHTWTISNTMVNNFRYGFTRESFSEQGDSGENSISFRFVFSPLTFTRTLERITPVQNFTDDLSWIKGDHTFGFGTNIRLIRNRRDSFDNAFDNAVTNPSFYQGGGASITNRIRDTFQPITGNIIGVQNAVTALIGRFSQYTANFTFDQDGTLLPSGTPASREFRTEEYDLYFQDSWKMTPNLTLTYGLRYGISTPVYEKNGFEVKTTVPLSDFFEMRREAAARGQALNTPLTLELSGKANNATPLYDWDKNNFQPRVAIAWSPGFKSGFLGKLFGKNHESVLRGGFAITNDYYGQQLAVTFDLNNTLGFSSGQTIAANTFNVTTRPAPLFTGFGQDVRTLPRIEDPGNVTFPRTQPFEPTPAGFAQDRRIETSMDSRLVAPINYSWNVTFERQLPKGLVFQTSYIGRIGRNLIASRDVMALNNLVDPNSGMDWYTAAGILERLRQAGTSIGSVSQIAYFANLLPPDIAQRMNDNYFGEEVIDPSLNQTQAVYAVAVLVYGNDWTDTQDVIEQGLDRNIFFHPQYGALSAHSSIGRSNYHAGTLSIRQRLGRSFSADFNYTLSHSHDDASGLQTADQFGGAFVFNPLRQKDNYAESDFDIRHIINANAVWEIPFGRGRTFFGGVNRLADALIGGWQITGILRWNTGLPIGTPFDDARWATNWNAQSNTVRTTDIRPCPERGGRLFGCNTVEAYRSFRNAFPGETGDRNVFRLPGYFNLDMGVGKAFNLPWNENHRLQLRVEAFNVTNTQRMNAPNTGSRTGYGLALDPQNIDPDEIPINWARFVGIQGAPRILQFGIRYSF